MAKQRVLYVVNPSGAVHDVTEEHARELLRNPGWRVATQAEIDQLAAQHGHQEADNPIAEPFKPRLPSDDEGEGAAAAGEERIDLADGVDDREAATAGKALAARRTTRKGKA